MGVPPYFLTERNNFYMKLTTIHISSFTTKCPSIFVVCGRRDNYLSHSKKGKVKSFLCLNIMPCRYIWDTSQTWELDGSEQSASCSSHFTPASIGQKIGWAKEPAWTWHQGEISLTLTGIQLSQSLLIDYLGSLIHNKSNAFLGGVTYCKQETYNLLWPTFYIPAL